MRALLMRDIMNLLLIIDLFQLLIRIMSAHFGQCWKIYKKRIIKEIMALNQCKLFHIFHALEWYIEIQFRVNLMTS
jgi:hypothetical protein